MNRKDNWSQSGTMASAKVFRNPFDTRVYDESVLKFISKKGFRNYYFSSIKSAQSYFPQLKNHAEVVENNNKLIDIDDGYHKDNYNDLFLIIQKKLIRIQEKLVTIS